jgi:hypothetical protein
VCKKCADMASTNAAGQTSSALCGCPVNTFSSTDTPDTTGCQPCPVNSYRNLVTTVVGESVDLTGEAVSTQTTRDIHCGMLPAASTASAHLWLACDRRHWCGCLRLQPQLLVSNALKPTHRWCSQADRMCRGGDTSC